MAGSVTGGSDRDLVLGGVVDSPGTDCSKESVVVGLEGVVFVPPVSHTPNRRSIREYGVGALPAGMDKLEPGLILAAMVTTVEDQNLSGFDRIVVLKARQRMVSFFQAQVCESMASISQLMDQLEADPQVAHDSAAAEIGAALRLTRRAADSDLALAVDLRERLPEVWERWQRGRSTSAEPGSSFTGPPTSR